MSKTGNKKIKDSVFPIVTAILTGYFLPKLFPIFDGFFIWLGKLGIGLSKIISDNIVQLIARGFPSRLLCEIIPWITGLLLGGLIYCGKYIFRHERERKEQFLNQCKELSQDSDKEKLTELKKTYNKEHSHIVQLFLALSLLILFTNWLLLGKYFIHYTAMNILNQIEIVAPYISDQEYKEIKSDFYSMESKEDFEALTERLDSVQKSS